MIVTPAMPALLVIYVTNPCMKRVVFSGTCTVAHRTPSHPHSSDSSWLLCLTAAGEVVSEREIPVELVEIGDLLRVPPGGIIPADGTVVLGNSAVNESMVTGMGYPLLFPTPYCLVPQFPVRLPHDSPSHQWPTTAAAAARHNNDPLLLLLLLPVTLMARCCYCRADCGGAVG